MAYFNPLLSLTVLFLFLFNHFSPSSALPDRYFKSLPSSLRPNISDEYFELTKPLPSDKLTPSCTLLLLQQDFANTIGSPPVTVPYSPPSNCSGPPWSYVVLEFSASCQGEQYDRIAGVWLDGVEILRTSTAEPTESGIFWKVRKDVTRYSSLFQQSNLTLSVMLENVVNEVYTGVYHVNISLLYYEEGKTVSSDAFDPKFNRKLGLLPGKFGFKDDESEGRYGFQSEGFISKEPGSRTVRGESSKLWYKKPADVIVPISDDGNEGFWFRIQSESDVRGKEIRIPTNTQKAVLEIYVSFHGNDEFWYSNPPDSYILANNMTTGRGNGAFRQVFAKIDEVIVGSEVPFPVIFTGGINPLFWDPVVPIGAFDLPSYDFDLAPFLRLLLDGKNHSIGIGVTDSISFWLVDANLHLWLDPSSSAVQTSSFMYQTDPLSIKRESKFHNLDGSFKIEAERKAQLSGWVNSTVGNFTLHIKQKFKFKNSIKFKRYGMLKEVEQKIEVKTEVKVESDTGDLLFEITFNQKYPLDIRTLNMPGSDDSTYLLITNISHSLNEKVLIGDFSSSISNSQDSGGWMVVQDHSVLSGLANTRQTLSSKDEFGCYSRTVVASNGKLLEDVSTSVCASSS